MLARIHYSKYLDEASTSWKQGNITDAISYYEKIPKFVYPVAGEHLFWIYINPENEVYDIQKAYFYIKSYQCKNKNQLINSAMQEYELSKNDKEYLKSKISEC